MRIRYFTYQSPLGTIYIASTENGVCKASLNITDEEFTETLRRWTDLKPSRDEDSFNVLKKELDSYFAGKPTQFSCSIDWVRGTRFQQDIWRALLKIPYGEVGSYKDIAIGIGKPMAAQAAGSAIGKNPVFLIVPCHRVIKSNGTIGGYGYGLEVKKRLLELEGVKLHRWEKEKRLAPGYLAKTE